MKYALMLTLVLTLSACQTTPKNSQQAESKKLTSIISDFQTYQDNGGFHQKQTTKTPPFPDLSPERLAQINSDISQFYQKLDTINAQLLSTKDQINLAVLRYNLKNRIDRYLNKAHYLPITAETGFHVQAAGFGQKKLTSEQEYKDYLAHLNAIPKYFDQQMAWLEKGIAEGITQPAIVLKGFEQSISSYITDDLTQSLFYQPFTNMPTQVSNQEELKAKAKQAILEQVNPAYQKFYHFMVNRYQPNARSSIAAHSLPNGKAFYDNRVKHFTTLDMSAEEVHEIGLAEVARIRAEMEEIILEVGHQGDFASFVNFLRTDKQFYATTPEALLKEAAYIAKKADAKLPTLFKLLPRKPYGVIPVPANIAPKYTTGRYASAHADNQPGNYLLNTYQLQNRPLYALEALTLHEAVPGHHLQISLSREMENVPKFRNSTYISAFGEGWALYSEYLGIEAGFYQDPYSDFGRLTYEMWRACRLVVDTGMHSQGWSRDKAMAFLADNTALSLHNVRTEIDRYISWPGQALSYKIGELTIKKLRQQAENTLKADFDIREFHDKILANGAIPLSFLEKIITDYIAEKEQAIKKKK